MGEEEPKFRIKDWKKEVLYGDGEGIDGQVNADIIPRIDPETGRQIRIEGVDFTFYSVGEQTEDSSL